MNDQSSTLVAHCGARKITRDELRDLPVPERTRTHQPLSHHEIVETLEEALSYRHLAVVRDEYAVSADGMKMFGVMDLNAEFTEGRFSIGLRNSNDKSMRLALTAGMRVFVCDNMAFSGDFAPLLHKHTSNFDLRDSVSIAIDRIQRGFAVLERDVSKMQTLSLTDNDARVLIYGAFMEKGVKGVPRHLMPSVHSNYFEPTIDAFRSRSLWSVANAFTSAFKQMAPTKRFEATARLGSFLKKYQEELMHISAVSEFVGTDDDLDTVRETFASSEAELVVPFPVSLPETASHPIGDSQRSTETDEAVAKAA